jgi:hypothetical protein
LVPRRRAEQALVVVICQAYVEGVSIWGVDDLVKSMGRGDEPLGPSGGYIVRDNEGTSNGVAQVYFENSRAQILGLSATRICHVPARDVTED